MVSGEAHDEDLWVHHPEVVHLLWQTHVVNDHAVAQPLDLKVVLAPDAEPELAVHLTQGRTNVLEQLAPSDDRQP